MDAFVHRPLSLRRLGACALGLLGLGGCWLRVRAGAVVGLRGGCALELGGRGLLGLGRRSLGLRRGRRLGLDLIGVLVGQRLVGLDAAVARAGQRRVGAAAAVGQDRRAAALLCVVLVVAVLGLLSRELRLGADVDPPAREPGGEPGVLALAADRQRELIVGHDHRGLLAGV